MKVLFVGKKDDFYCERAAEFIADHFVDPLIILGKRGDVFPADAVSWSGDYIISYLSPWIIPSSLLKATTKSAINFHPGPPEYPGIGCTNFAIYDEVESFGITCHHMANSVDTGPIIAVDRFRIFKSDTVYSITHRCYAQILNLFYRIISDILEGRDLPVSHERWQKQPYKRSDLDALCRITPDMSVTEIRRRIRATTFPKMPGAYIDLAGKRFKLSLD